MADPVSVPLKEYERLKAADAIFKKMLTPSGEVPKHLFIISMGDDNLINVRAKGNTKTLAACILEAAAHDEKISEIVAEITCFVTDNYYLMSKIMNQSNNLPIIFPVEMWLESHLSIARHYGAVKFHNEIYAIVGEKGDLVHIEFVMQYCDMKRKKFLRKYEKKTIGATIPNRLMSRLAVFHHFQKQDIKPNLLPNVEDINGAVNVTIPANN